MKKSKLAKNQRCEYCHFCTEEMKSSGNVKCIMPVPLDEYVGKVPELRINKDGYLEAMDIT